MRTTIIAVLIIVILAAGAVGVFLLRIEFRTKQAESKMEEAYALFEAGESAKVVEALRPVYDDFRRYKRIDEVIVLLAKCYELSDQPDTGDVATQLWREIVENYPETPNADLARLKLANAILENSPAEAKVLFDQVAGSSDQELASQARVGQAQLLEKDGKIDDARALYMTVIQNSGAKAAQGLAFDRLSEMNHRLLFSPNLDPFSEVYEIKKGDSLYKIAVNHHCSVKYLVNTNLISGELRPGQTIKVPSQGWKIVVDKEDLYLYLLTKDGRFVKRYRVGTGKQDFKTLEGTYKIKNKEKEPTWFKPGGGVIQYGEEGHELGTRWMGLAGPKMGLGIHGTDKPDTVGQRLSAGCIRMINNDVEELFTITPVGTQVDIVTGFQLSDYQGSGSAGDEGQTDEQVSDEGEGEAEEEAEST